MESLESLESLESFESLDSPDSLDSLDSLDSPDSLDSLDSIDSALIFSGLQKRRILVTKLLFIVFMVVYIFNVRVRAQR